MSLYVGHLSPHVRSEDLLRVFQRFGPCRIQLKDGYGFAVYEARADAERALRNLKGTFICGKPISLTWSNRQPRHFHIPARISRAYEPFHRRISGEGNNGVGIRDSQGQTEPNAISAHASPNNHEKHHLDDVLDKDAVQSTEDIVDIEGDKDATSQGVVNGNVTSDVNHLDTDRWGQPVSDSLNSHGKENGNDFDRYEPYHGYKDDNENVNMDNSYGSRERGRTREKRWRNDSDYDTERNFEMSKPQPTCYNCGQMGHIVRNCPQAIVHRYKFSKINVRKEELDIRERGRLEKLRYSPGAPPDANLNPVISMHHKRDRKESHSGRFERLPRSKGGLPESKENRPMLRGDSQSKKRYKMEHKPSKRSIRRGHVSRSSSSSRSSQSPRSNSVSHSKSRGTISSSSSSRLRCGSSRSHSAASSSKSVPKSPHSKSMNSRSRSRSISPSRSSSKSFSLSVSLELKPCSPENKQTETCMTSSPRNNMEKKSHELENKKTNSACLNVEDEDPRTLREVDNGKGVGQLGHIGGSSRDSRFSIDHNKNIDSKESVPPHQDNSTAFVNHQPNREQLERHLLKSEKQVPAISETHGATNITCEEIFSALQHYGLGTSEGQTALSVEDHFGASRLWPWEIIYYRRLKKGPISIENYARRLHQNKEFCIVDKYVRGSSGWGEVIKDD